MKYYLKILNILENISFYESLVKYIGEDEDLNNKIKNFLNSLKRCQDEEKYMSLGFNNYLPKPIAKEELNKIMKEFLK